MNHATCMLCADALFFFFALQIHVVCSVQKISPCLEQGDQLESQLHRKKCLIDKYSSEHTLLKSPLGSLCGVP